MKDNTLFCCHARVCYACSTEHTFTASQNERFHFMCVSTVSKMHLNFQLHCMRRHPLCFWNSPVLAMCRLHECSVIETTATNFVFGFSCAFTVNKCKCALFRITLSPSLFMCMLMPWCNRRHRHRQKLRRMWEVCNAQMNRFRASKLFCLISVYCCIANADISNAVAADAVYC